MVDSLARDLLALDRDVARAVTGLARWREALSEMPGEPPEFDPFEGVRHVSTKSTWDALRDLQASVAETPLREGLTRWVAALLGARIGLVDQAAWARESAAARGRFEGAEPRQVGWREAWRGVVEARDLREASLWMRAASEAGPPVAAVARTGAARRWELARRMGLAHPWRAIVAVAPETLRLACRRLLDATEDLSRAVWKERLGQDIGVSAVLHAAVASDAAEGWPARLTGRWLNEMFGALAGGLPVVVPPLPTALGASSFARALVAFGHAVRVAGASRSLPFALAREPGFVAAHRLGCVFGGLAADATFHVRALGLARRAAAAQSRTLARTALLEARVHAARLLLCDEEALAPAPLFDELGARLFGRSLDPGLRGAWPAWRADEPARLVALLEAPRLRAHLRGRFDADWFRNPHAWADLRSESAHPAYEPVEEAALVPAADALARAFEEVLG